MATSHRHAPPLRRLHYLTARWQLLDVRAVLTRFDRRDCDATSFDRVPLGAVSRLPIPLQAAFRRKLLVIFALQVLCVTVVSAVFRFAPSAKRLADHVLVGGDNATLVFAVCAGATTVLALLSALVAVRRRFPLNWFVLLLFTVAQSGAAVALGVVLDSDLVVFNCAFALVGVTVMCALCGVRRESLAEATVDGGDKHELLSTLSTSLIAYVVASGLFLCAGGWHALVVSDTRAKVAYSLLFQLALALWFSVDVASMYRAMSPDEYMLGVINFYIDLVLLAIVTAVVVAVVALVTASCAAVTKSDSCRACDCPCCDGGGVDAAADCCGCCVRACDSCCVLGARQRAAHDNGAVRRRRTTTTATMTEPRDAEEDEEEAQRLLEPLLRETAMDRV